MAEVGGPLATEEELQRLQDILAMFPTTEAEDERLLTGAIEQCPPTTFSFLTTHKSIIWRKRCGRIVNLGNISAWLGQALLSSRLQTLNCLTAVSMHLSL